MSGEATLYILKHNQVVFERRLSGDGKSDAPNVVYNATQISSGNRTLALFKYGFYHFDSGYERWCAVEWRNDKAIVVPLPERFPDTAYSYFLQRSSIGGSYSGVAVAIAKQDTYREEQGYQHSVVSYVLQADKWVRIGAQTTRGRYTDGWSEGPTLGLADVQQCVPESYAVSNPTWNLQLRGLNGFQSYDKESPPVVLIHGWNSDSSKLESLKNLIWNTEPGMFGSVLFFGYDWSKHIDENARLLRDEIESGTLIPKDAQFVIVAHSMGGLVARRYLEDSSWNGHKRLKKLITLGTPHHGSPLANPAWLQSYSSQGTVVKYGLDTFDLAIKGVAQYVVPLNNPGGYCLGWDNFDETMPKPIWDGAEKIPAANRFTMELNQNLLKRGDKQQILDKYFFIGSYYTEHKLPSARDRIPGYILATQFQREDGTIVSNFTANDGVVPLSSAVLITDWNHQLHIEAGNQISLHENSLKQHAIARYAVSRNISHSDLDEHSEIFLAIARELGFDYVLEHRNEPAWKVLGKMIGYGRKNLLHMHEELADVFPPGRVLGAPRELYKREPFLSWSEARPDLAMPGSSASVLQEHQAKLPGATEAWQRGGVANAKWFECPAAKLSATDQLKAAQVFAAYVEDRVSWKLTWRQIDHTAYGGPMIFAEVSSAQQSLPDDDWHHAGGGETLIGVLFQGLNSKPIAIICFIERLRHHASPLQGPIVERREGRVEWDDVLKAFQGKFP